MPKSPASLLAMVVSAIVLSALVAFLVLVQVPELTYFLDSDPTLRAISESVAESPGAAVIAFIPAAVLILLVCIVGSVLANIRFRRELRETYLVDTSERSEREAESEVNVDGPGQE